MPRPSVVIIRELDRQTTGGGCCGTLEGGPQRSSGTAVFAGRRADMECAGAVTQALRAEFGPAVTIAHVDPRNLLAVWALLLRDCLRSRRGPGAILRVLGLGVRVPSVFVDGAAVPGPGWPSAGAVLAAVHARQTGRGLEPAPDLGNA